MQVATSPTALIEGGAPSLLRIPALENGDLADVIAWARSEQCALGQGDVANYRHTDAAAVGLCGGRRDAEDVSGQPAGGFPWAMSTGWPAWSWAECGARRGQPLLQ